MWRFLFIAVAIFGVVFPAGADEIIPVFGVAERNYISVGRSIGTEYCFLENRASGVLSRGAVPVITGIVECKNRYSDPELFYEIVHRGNVYFVAKGDVAVKEEGVARLKSLSEETQKTYRQQAILFTKAEWAKEIKESFSRLESTKKYGIAILKASIYDMSEYTEGTGFEVKLYNPTKKTIKYVTIDYVGYNSVKDVVRDYKNRKGKVTFRGIGPIPPGTTASYTSDYAWMSDLPETFKITAIKVEYMDGTTKKVTDVGKITMNRQTYQTLEDFSKEVDNAEAEKTADAGPAAAPAAR